MTYNSTVRDHYTSISGKEWDTVANFLSEKEIGIICDAIWNEKDKLSDTDYLHNDYAHLLYKLSAVHNE